MKIGIISDTHDHYGNVVKAIEIFRKHEVRVVLHAGDMVSASTAQLFSELAGVRFIAVFGNCDVDRSGLRSAVEGFGGEIHDGAYQSQVDDRAVCMAHTPRALQQAAEGGQYDLLVYGHTHRDDVRQVGKTLVVNPGEATDTRTGFGQVLVLDTTDLSLDIEPLT
jgi:putative phosphoesterase